METSPNGEAAIVAVGSAAGAVATYLVTQDLPVEIKAPLVTVLGAFSIAILAYWKAKVNVPVT